MDKPYLELTDEEFDAIEEEWLELAVYLNG